MTTRSSQKPYKTYQVQINMMSFFGTNGERTSYQKKVPIRDMKSLVKIEKNHPKPTETREIETKQVNQAGF